MKKRTFVLDCEVFPNFFSVIFRDWESDYKKTFLIFNGRDETPRLRDFIENEVKWLVGYNSTMYDDIILNYIIYADRTNTEIYQMSGEIINSQKGGQKLWFNKDVVPYMRLKYFKSMDLYTMMGFNKSYTGLKQVAIAMKWYKIQDLPKPFDEAVTEDEVMTILEYNDNDVLITKELLIRQMDEVKIRMDVTKEYGINVMSKSRAAMGDSLMSKFWEQETGIPYREFKKEKTEYSLIEFKDCVSSEIEFKSETFNKLLNDIKSTIWYPGDKLKYSVTYGSSKYTIGLGGLHSHNKPAVTISEEGYKLIDLDVRSYYPNLILNTKSYPKHLSERFLRLFKRVIDKRVAAKASGDKSTSEGLKESINSIYGKMLAEYGWLMDAKAGYTTTLTGQLSLLMLVEQLEDSGIAVFYANTDGLTCNVAYAKEEEFYSICKKWEKLTNLDLEFAEYQKTTIRDVNSYLIIKDDGSTKLKGTFLTEIDMTKGYDKPVVAKALYEYFVNGTSVEDFIKSHDDIYDFCMAQKVGGQYKVEHHYIKDGKGVIDQCQKTNRYFVSNGLKKLYKRKDNGSLQDLVADRGVTIFNDYYESKDYDINYNYYIRAAQKIIDTLEPKQLKLL